MDAPFLVLGLISLVVWFPIAWVLTKVLGPVKDDKPR